MVTEWFAIVNLSILGGAYFLCFKYNSFLFIKMLVEMLTYTHIHTRGVAHQAFTDTHTYTHTHAYTYCRLKLKISLKQVS